MKRSNRVVILVGVLLAIAAFVAIVILLNSREETAEPEDVTETVLVATQDIAIGDTVTPDVVEEQEVEPGEVVGTPLSDTSQVSGQPALFAVPAGSQVTAETIGEDDGGGGIDISAMLNPGEKAIAIRVDEQTGTGLLVQEGDSVDVVISTEIEVLQPTADSLANPDGPQRFEPIEGLGSRTVKAILQNKRVLYVSGTRAEEPEPQDTNGDGTVDENDAPPAETTVESVLVVIAGSLQEAEAVKWAQRDRSELSSERTEVASSISLVVRHADDEDLEETVGVTIDSLVSEYGLRIPGIVEELGDQ